MSPLPESVSPVLAAVGARSTAAAASPILDLDVLLRSAAGDPELARYLLELFGEMAAPIFDRLAAAMQSGDCAASKTESHALMGATGLIGAVELTSLLREIEVLSFHQERARVVGALAGLAPVFLAVTAAARQALQDVDAPAGLATRVVDDV